MAKGMFTPKNPAKYQGDPTKIRFLSSWELRFMWFCDTNPNVLTWGSETLRVPYWNPIKKKVATYWPDFIIKYRDAQGVEHVEVVEIKPHKQASLSSSAKGRKPKISAYDQVQLVINHAKWTAAEALCKQHNIKFRVLTEQELFKR